MNNVLEHHGILGMKWGVRRYQNPDGSLTEAGRRHLEKQDEKWAKKNSEKITRAVQKASSKEMSSYLHQLLQEQGAINKDGRASAKTINAYNQRLAQVMSTKVSDLQSPSGKIVTFVAKRGSVGVYMALADAGYDMSQVKNGVWSSGRVAYKKSELDKVNI